MYVCTAAERQYALEVWRLLDRTGVIIPEDDRSKRVVNVPGGGVRAKKTLYNSLGLLPAHSMDNPLQPPTPLAADDDAGGMLHSMSLASAASMGRACCCPVACCAMQCA